LSYDALRAAGVDALLKLLPNADHGSPDFFSPDATSTVDALLARLLKR
jgi:hypothetical protein